MIYRATQHPCFNNNRVLATSLSMPVVTSGLNKTALAPPPIDFPHVISRRFVGNCISNPFHTVPFYVAPSLQSITTVTKVTPQRFRAHITNNSSLATEIFSNLPSRTHPSSRVLHQSIKISQALTITIEVSGKTVQTSETVVPARSGSTVLSFNASSQTKPNSTGIIATSCLQVPLSVNNPPFMPAIVLAELLAPARLSVQDPEQTSAASKKDHIAEWKLYQNNGDPLQSHKWFGQFKSAID